jgi:hypothetical protein
MLKRWTGVLPAFLVSENSGDIAFEKLLLIKLIPAKPESFRKFLRLFSIAWIDLV